MGIVIFLHGSGDTGEGIRSWLAQFRFQQQHSEHRFIFPTASRIPYSLCGGEPSTVWFDRTSLALTGEEQTTSVQKSMARIDEMIDEIIRNGTPAQQIVLGGFSQGGCLALQVALTGKHAGSLGGVFAFSSFLYNSTALSSEQDSHGKLPAEGVVAKLPVLMTHGEDDGMIPVASGRATAERVSALRKWRVSFVTFPGLQHEFDRRCLDKLSELLQEVFVGSTSGETQ